MNEQEAIIIVIVGLSALLTFYGTMKKLFADPVLKLMNDLKDQHEEFKVEITSMNHKIEKNYEALIRTQNELNDLDRRVTDNTTRIFVLERVIDKGVEKNGKQ